MEVCKYESDLKRILKIIDGNATPGLVVKVNKLEYDMTEMMEVAQANLTTINALNRFVADIKILDKEKVKCEAQNSKVLYFVIAQTVVIILAVIGYFATQ